MTEPLPWRVLCSELLLDCSPWLRVVRQRVQLPSGVVIDDYIFTPNRDYSMVVAVTAAREVLLVRQYKHGLGRMALEFPAGYLDAPDEDPLACARRELLEETGFTARRWLALGAFAIDLNRAPNVVHFFLASELERTDIPQPEATEAIAVLLVPATDIASLLRSGQMPGVSSAGAWAMAAPHIL